MKVKQIGLIMVLFFVTFAGTMRATQTIDVGVRYVPVAIMTGDNNTTKVGQMESNVEPYVNYLPFSFLNEKVKLGFGTGALIGRGPYVDSSFDASNESVFAPYLGVRAEATAWRLTLGLEGGAEYTTVPDTYNMSSTTTVYGGSSPTIEQINFELDQSGGGFSPYGRLGLDYRVVSGLSLGVSADFEYVQRTVWGRGRYNVGGGPWTSFDYGTKSVITTWLQPSAELKYRF